MNRKKRNHPVSTWWYCLTNDGTGSVEGGTQYCYPFGSTWGGTCRYLVAQASKRRYRLVIGATRSVWGGTGRYLMVLGQYNLVLLGIKWCWFSKGLFWLYILKKWRFGRVSPIPHRLTERQTRKNSATQASEK